ncbi:MAG: PD40 domain-containing protein [Chloroflexi bacterium]|nr:PD40 domain-containing protein [Chloroflexota bacterium]
MNKLLAKFTKRPSRFDSIILGTIGALLVVIAGLILLGDTTGVRVVHHSPNSLASADAAIRLEFDRPMVAQSVEDRFSITPMVEGHFEWANRKELVFRPDAPLNPGQKYAVLVKAGAESDEHSTLSEDFQFNFTIRLPQMAYLGPFTKPIRNLQWMDLQTGRTEQLTDEAGGVTDFAISPDGKWVAYTVDRTATASDIWALNFESREHIQLTNCAEGQATCYDPAWGPNNQVVAYTRQELAAGLNPATAKRAWVVDVNTGESRLLIDDETLVGFAPKWSPDGKWVAIVLATANPPGILLYEFETAQSVFVATPQGVPGVFSPDSGWYAYSKLAYGAADTTYYSHLAMINLNNLASHSEISISGETENPVDDLQAAFHPDGTKLAVVRRYLDNRYTQGGQLYLVDMTTFEATPLVVDAAYSHGAINWSKDGHLLLFQRYNLETREDPTEIWMVNITTGELEQVVADGFLPRFLP